MSQKSTPVPVNTRYFNLGSFARRIDTSSAEAQIWFNRGLIWAYGFNHDEAITCFQQVIAYDPTCLMGYWGIAYSSGPHYNKSWSAFDKNDLATAYERGNVALVEAEKQIDESAEKLDLALLEAIRTRFPLACVEDELKKSNEVYANAMRKVYHDFGQDLDVLVLTADALMNTAPWHLFESRTGHPNLSTPVIEIGEILQQGMSCPGANDHPGLLHLYIHYMEMSATPEKALVPADRLRYLVPDSGHLQHMPSHIYLLIGDYRQAVDANLKAAQADDKYWHVHPDVLFYTVYRLHNFHSLIYAAMMAGQSKVALAACDRLEAALPESLLRLESPPMADWTEVMHSARMHVLVRFGMWDTIKDLALPEDQKLYCVKTAFTHYAKGIAHAATGQVKKAELEQRSFLQSVKRVPRTRLNFPNTVADGLHVAEAMLSGEILYRKGRFSEAFDELRVAITRDDSLVYSEPWGWTVPTRHAYAALLLEQGQVEKAAVAYAQDLGLDDSLASAHQHPSNIWSLKGYHECLVKLRRKQEASIIGQQLRIAEMVADIEVKASCFCSVSAVAKTDDNCGTCHEKAKI